ncbi:MAG: NADH-quinone oxidoreductase subunit L [Myxococcota bacterium]|nr:NADH-quinone oxidoreductase subunit L [Myxococcota bacterium]
MVESNPYIAWIVGFPLLGAILNGFLLSWTGKLLPRGTRANLTARSTVGLIAVLCVVFPFLIALAATIRLVGGSPGREFIAVLWQWLPLAGLVDRGLYHGAGLFPPAAADLSVAAGFVFDRLSAVMTLVVTGVGSLIHIYSIGYMGHDPGYRRYFAYLNLFVFSMLVLVLADNMVLMFVGWEGVGLCSYLLIGFWFDKEANAAAGKKAFVVNRIGDLGFILGILLLVGWLGAVDWNGLREAVAVADPDVLSAGTVLGTSVAFLACMFLLLGAAGKSAQIPLFVWLPDAMAGPTPVSALIHAATMVTAGVYMIARLDFLFLLSPTAMAVVATVGAATALFAATIGFAQTDIKRVLAYSTISQLGYMFLAVGVGAFSAGIFHLFTHAFFKACLFLCAGSVIHAMADRQDIREMGGLRRVMPVTHWTFLVATLAIAGCPPLSGFFSKDEILWTAFSGTAILRSGLVPDFWPVVLWLAGLAAAGCTAFYMFRVYFLVFWGDSRAPEEVRSALHAPERRSAASWLFNEPHTPVSMRLVLIVLGACSAAAGLIGMPHVFHVPNLFQKWLAPSVAAFAGGGAALEEWFLMGVSVLVAVLGAWTAWTFYREYPSRQAQAVVGAAPRLYRLVLDKYRIDEAYGWSIVRPARSIAFACYEIVDRVLIDTILVTGSAYAASAAGAMFRRFQSGVIHRYAAVMAIGLAGAVLFVAKPFASVPLVERPIAFATDGGRDPATGEVLLRLAMPDAPYVYEVDAGPDGELDVDPETSPERGPSGAADTIRLCLPEGDHVVRVTARSRFEMSQAIDLAVRVEGAVPCAAGAGESGIAGGEGAP